MSIQPFNLEIPDATLADLSARLATTRLPPTRADDWEAGTSPRYLRDLLDYWRSGYDWRHQEHELRRFSHFRTRFDDTTIHFIHERGKGPDPFPIVLTHGYPDSFWRFVKLIPLLTDPGAHGGNPRDAFDVVVPSLPGYAFSQPAGDHADIFHVGTLWNRLMTEELGYSRYAAHGGDWGSTVTEHLARSHASAVVGIHLTDVPFWHAFQRPKGHTDAEGEYFKHLDAWQAREAAYAMIQGSKPQTLADGLNDSPAGLAAWLVQFYQRWSDCNGDIETRFTKDELLTNIMIYWATGTIGTSFLPYYDLMHARASRWMLEKAKEWVGSSMVPTAIAQFPKDLSKPPREWAERFFNVTRWTQMPRGGHFAALEEPELLADDIREFFRPLRAVPELGQTYRVV